MFCILYSFQNVKNDLRIRLAFYTFSFTQYHIKHTREEVFHNLLRRSLVLIAGNRQMVSLCLERRQQFRNTLIRTRVVAIVYIIIGNELCTYAQHILLRTLRFRQSTTNQVIDAVAHHPRILFYLVCRKVGLFQRIVARIAQVVNRIEQRSV